MHFSPRLKNETTATDLRKCHRSLAWPLASYAPADHTLVTPPVEAHRPVVTYLQFPIQVCLPCNDAAQPATPTSVTDNLTILIVV